MKLQQYKDYPIASLVDREYMYLSGRAARGTSDFPLPYIGDLIEETWNTLTLEENERVIQDWVVSGAYERFGYDRRDFIQLASKGMISQVIFPELSIKEIQFVTLEYLNARFYTFIHYNNEMVNSPIGVDIW